MTDKADQKKERKFLRVGCNVDDARRVYVSMLFHLSTLQSAERNVLGGG